MTLHDAARGSYLADKPLWEQALPAELAAKGRRVGNELAWTQTDALQVLQKLEAAGCRVLGVDAWGFIPPDAEHPSPLGRDWDAERDDSTWREFVMTYASRFFTEIPASSVVWFNITAGAPGKASP